MDERAFSVAIDGFAVHDLPLSVDVEAEKRIRNALDSGGMLLVGEIHGAAENALVLYTLARRFDVTTVGLEWPPELTPAVSAFLAGGPVPHAPIAGSADGRITAGHFAVLRKLHSEGRLHQAVMFSRLAADRSWSDRDSDMASRLLAEVGDQPALVFAGNLHTSLVPHRYGVPMGVHLARARPSTVEIRLVYVRGTYFNLARRKVRWKVRSLFAPTEPTLRWAASRALLTLPVAHAAIVPAS